MLGLLLVLFGFGLFIFFLYLGDILNGDSDKIMDESCYYCIYSEKPHSIRDESKCTCAKIDNTGWTSEQIRNCKYRVKEN